MLIALGFLGIGFVILGLGAELMVRGSSTIALKMGISPLIIGLTVVAFGTSAPELAVSIQSTLNGRSSLALGNVIGSNIANIGLILGLMAIIRPINIELQLIKKQIPLVIASSLFMWLLLIDGEIGFIDGIFLCCALLGFLFFSYTQAKKDAAACELIASNPIISVPKKPTPFYIFILIIGVVMLVYGCTIFVDSAVELAQLLGISEAVIGLSIVAIGTSVPELATSLIAAYKNEPGLAVGNIIGSNLYNILGILGITALLDSIIGTEFNLVDFGVMLAYALVLLPFAWTNLQISRKEGFVLLGGYIAYMFYLFPSM
ncbi:MAG: calcium/sodium antiporter [Gammaproteobacteria bacterium]|nr:calcium/sodium antiporter [Gammaproteobacteria bacterium]